MERDVEELERLRKLDEERAARERQRAIEEERRRAAEQAAQSAAPQLDSDGTPAAPAFGTTTVAPAEPEGGSPPPDKQPAEKQAGDKLDATRPAPTVQRQPGQRPRINGRRRNLSSHSSRRAASYRTLSCGSPPL